MNEPAAHARAATSTPTIEQYDVNDSCRVYKTATGPFMRTSDHVKAIKELTDERDRALSDAANSRITIANMQELLKKKSCK